METDQPREHGLPWPIRPSETLVPKKIVQDRGFHR